MANAVKFIRYFVFVALSLQSPCAMAMDTTRMPFPQSFPSYRVPMVPAFSVGKGVSTSISLKNFAPIFKFLSSMVNRCQINLSQFDLSQCRSSIVESVRNNPGIYAAMAALSGGMACYYACE